ncbi:MAG: AAA ATPase Elf1 [Chaenotheca gracillima]|nr:MAG: AAA ATPase Elf1 [Chaenotheca gracillima]
MGKRKKSSRKPQGPKRQEPLPTTFSCLFCNHEKSIMVKLDKKAGIGQLSCKVCGQSFQTGINYLSAAVDVYADWIDASDEVKQGAAGDALAQPSAGASRGLDSGRALSPTLANRGLIPEDDGFIINDEVGAEDAYADG